MEAYGGGGRGADSFSSSWSEESERLQEGQRICLPMLEAESGSHTPLQVPPRSLSGDQGESQAGQV